MGAEIEACPPGAEVELGTGFKKVQQFAELIAREGETRGIIGPRELERLWVRHLLNSAAVARFLPSGSGWRLADVGSGGGFPGIVLATMIPDVEVHLIEAMARRIEWLEFVRAELQLDNVVLHHCRAEEYVEGRGAFEVVTSRAVGSLDKLIRWSMPLVAGGGMMLALKGEKARAEVDAVRKLFKKYKIVSAQVHEVESGGETTRVVALEKR